MSRQTVDFAYSVGDEVRIVVIDTLARVNGLCLVDEGRQYKVVWWNNGSRCCEWLHEWEIAPAPAPGL